MSAKRKAASALANEAKKPRPGNSITSFFAPTTTIKASNFDKQKWVDSLTAEQKNLLKLEIDTLHESWIPSLKEELVSPEFLKLKQFLKTERQSNTVFPPDKDIYSWSRHTPLDKVKIVILGQDPYHGPNQAMGLSFSVRPGVPAPASLQNMYRELSTNYPSFKAPPSRGGDLRPWADHGVLMLNACLTVRSSDANSHKNRGWERFTQKAIDAVASKRPGVVFMAWGNNAKQRLVKVDKKKHCVLHAVHPSPLGANRGGWFGCGHFLKANQWLVQRFGEGSEVEWSLVQGKSVLGKEPVVEEKTAVVEKDTVTETAKAVKTSQTKVEVTKSAKVAKEEDEFGFEDEDMEEMLELAQQAEREHLASSPPPTTIESSGNGPALPAEQATELVETVEKTDESTKTEFVEPAVEAAPAPSESEQASEKLDTVEKPQDESTNEEVAPAPSELEQATETLVEIVEKTEVAEPAAEAGPTPSDAEQVPKTPVETVEKAQDEITKTDAAASAVPQEPSTDAAEASTDEKENTSPQELEREKQILSKTDALVQDVVDQEKEGVETLK